MKNNYKNTKVLILGLGINEGGLGAAKFFARQEAQVIVSDLKNKAELKSSIDRLVEFKNTKFVLGEHRFEDIDWADIIIRNQAITPGNKYFQYALEKGKKIEMDVGIFLENVNCRQIIGITGTKGKTTTASLIYTALGHDRNVVLAGNIGKSVLDTLDIIDNQTKIVLELSSFQLQAFDEKKLSPHIAVITNIYPDHLNYHQNMDEYINLKKVIGKYQSGEDFLFIPDKDPVLNSKEFQDGLKGQILHFSPDDLPPNFKPVLPGEHNRLNYSAALAVVKKLGLSPNTALMAMKEFKGAEFRLQLVKKWNSIKFFNDSTATNPDSTIQALKTLPSSILICGGMDKGLSYQGLASQIDKSAKAVFFLDGDATNKIKAFMKHSKIVRSVYSDLQQLLKDVKTEAREGDTVIFSPGATSFNLFQNEFDRGRKFNQAIEKIFK